MRGAAPRADHDGRRGGQAERAGAGDDEHADGEVERAGKRSGQHDPDEEDERRESDHDRHEDAGDLVRRILDRRLRPGGFVDKRDDARKDRVVAGAADLHREISRDVQGRTRDLVARSFVHRYAFAGNGALVKGSAAFDHHAVERHAFTRTHHEHIAYADLLDRDDLFNAAFQNRGRLGCKVHELAHGVGRAAFRTGFEILPQRDQRQDHAR